MPPEDIPGAGRFSALMDPQGAVFAVYTDGDVGGHDGPAQLGEFSWHELMTEDYKAALEFYVELFGWKEQMAMDMGEAGIYQLYGRVDEMPLGGMFNKPPGAPMPSAWIQYVRVENVEVSADKVKELGGQVVNGPMDVPGGDRIVQCTDPQGAFFAMHQVGGGSLE